MERKWEQRILPPIPLKLCTKHSLGQTESMSQMQMSIAVRIGEGDNKFLLLAPIVIVAGVTLKGLFTFPHSLNFHLGGTQGIALGGSLGSGADGKVGHLGSRRSGWCHFAQYILNADTTALSLAAMNESFASSNFASIVITPLLPDLLKCKSKRCSLLVVRLWYFLFYCTNLPLRTVALLTKIFAIFELKMVGASHSISS